MLIDVAELEREYFARRPDPSVPAERVSFGTSGHRGTSLDGVVQRGAHPRDHAGDLRVPPAHGIDGPLYLGKDTHALSAPAQRTALEVLAANGVDTFIQRDDGFTPTPVDLARDPRVQPRPQRAGSPTASSSRRRTTRRADGGFKYNPPNGGPADTDVTRWVQDRANELLRGGNAGVRRLPLRAARCARRRRTSTISSRPYVDDLGARRRHGRRFARPALRSAVDPLGGAAVGVLGADRERYGLDLDRREPERRPDVRVHDGRPRRQDPDGLFEPLRDGEPRRVEGPVSVAFGNDPDADRHGIVTPSAGLMNPNHYLAVAIRYLLTHRPALAARAPRSARRWSAAA